MGVWDFIYSTTETVKRNAPDLSPVKNACKASYGYGSAAFWKIDDAVRVNGVQTLKNYMSDEQGRAQIALFASKLVQNAAYYGFKEAHNFVPGGKIVETLAKIVSQTVSEVKSENLKKQVDKEKVEERMISSCGNISVGARNVIDRAERQSKGTEFGYEKGISADSASNQTPEGVLRIFMKKNLTGSRLDDLIIPRKGQQGKETK